MRASYLSLQNGLWGHILTLRYITMLYNTVFK